MSEAHVPPAPAAAGSDERAIVLVVYGLYLFALLSCGLAGIAGVIVAYVKRGEVLGTLWESHFDNQINAFWGWFALVVAGVVMIPIFGLGLIVIGVAFVWFLYRTIKGLLRALESQPYV
jgi:uncharacterized membrane protein